MPIPIPIPIPIRKLRSSKKNLGGTSRPSLETTANAEGRRYFASSTALSENKRT
jgi:hypothetical protein